MDGVKSGDKVWMGLRVGTRCCVGGNGGGGSTGRENLDPHKNNKRL